MSKHIEDMAEGLPDSPIWAYPKYMTQIGVDLASEDKQAGTTICILHMGTMTVQFRQSELRNDVPQWLLDYRQIIDKNENLE